MKRKVLIIFVAIIILCTISVIYYYYSITTSKEIDVNKLLDNPDEYNNPIYLMPFSLKERLKLHNSMTESLFEKCENGKVEGNCTHYFLLSYINMMINSDTRIITPRYETTTPYHQDYLNLLRSLYSDFKSQYETLTEDDLKGFTIPILVGCCNLNLNIISTPDRIYWMTKILDINKTNSHSTEMQILYLSACMEIHNVTFLNAVLNDLNREGEVCSMLPEKEDVNMENPCSIYDYINAKRFCGVSLTEDKDMVESSLSTDYDAYYQKLCNYRLVQLYNFIYAE